MVVTRADEVDDDAGRLLKAGSEIASESVHLHSNGRTTTAHLEIGFEAGASESCSG